MSQSDKITMCSRCYTETWENQRCFLLRFEGRVTVQHEEHVVARTGPVFNPQRHPCTKLARIQSQHKRKGELWLMYPKPELSKGSWFLLLFFDMRKTHGLPFLWLGFFFLLFVLSATRRDPGVKNPTRIGNCTLQKTPLPDIHQGAFYRLIRLLSRYGLSWLLSCSKPGSHLRKGSKKI